MFCVIKKAPMVNPFKQCGKWNKVADMADINKVGSISIVFAEDSENIDLKAASL